ncbi:hypothetical protein ACFL2T_06995, partial [Elusimicrobiota bacterium]
TSSELAGAFNVFLGKFDPDLVFLGSVTANGSASGDDAGYGIAIDGSDNLYLTGIMRLNGTLDDIWIAKYDSDLVMIASRTQAGFGGGQDVGEDIILSGGKLYVTSMISESVGASNVRLGEYTTDLVFIDSAGFSGGTQFSLDWGRSLAAIPGGGFYIVGSIESGLSTTDAWIGRFDSDLAFVSSATMDGSATSGDFDRAEGLAVDQYGQIYVTGRLFETGVFDNVWTAKYDTDMVVRSSDSFDGEINQKDNGEDVVLASDGAIFVTGGVDTGLYGWLGKYYSYNSPPAIPGITEVFYSSLTMHYGPVGADAYMMEASTASDFSGTMLSSFTSEIAISTLTVIGLGANTTYYLRVGALWGSATYYATTESTATLAYAPASAASTFLSVSVTSMTLAWDRNGNAEDITSYLVALTTGAGYPNAFTGNVASTLKPGGANPMAFITSLESNTTYSLFIEAINHNGIHSGFTSFGSTSTLAAAPLSAVSTYTAMSFDGFGAIWDANGNQLGRTTYTVEASTASDFNAGVTDGTSFSTVPASGPQATFSGLGANTTYYVRIRAQNHNGIMSDFALLGSSSTLARPPSAVAFPFAVVGESSMTVAWNRNTNPVDVTTYTAVLSTGASYPNAFSGNVSLTTSPGGTDPAATFPSLEINATYFLYVEATNHNGIGSGFPVLGSTSTLAAAPLSVVSTFTAVVSNGFSALWDANGNTLGRTTYSVEASSASDFNAGVSDRVILSTVPAAGPQATFPGLGANTTYYFRLRARNHNGVFTAYTALGSTITRAHMPGTVALTYPAVHLSSMSVSWGPNSNPLVVTTYTVVLTTGSSYPNPLPGNVSLTTTPASSPPTATPTGLEPNTTYFLFVDAVNYSGASSGFSAVGSTSTLARVPASAVSTFTAATSDGFGAAWDLNGNVLGVTTFTIHASTASDFNAGASDEAYLSTAPTAGPQATFSGLGANTTYYLRARALNHNGLYTDYTALGSTITLAYVPSAATAFLDVQRTSMTVGWAHNGNVVDVTTYTVALSSGAGYPNAFSGNSVISTVPIGAAPMATLGSLVVNTTYFLYVEAVNHSGAGSGYAALGSTATLVYAPAAAGASFDSVHHTSMSVLWDHNSNLVGLTTYTVVLTTGSAYPNAFSGNVSVSTLPGAGAPMATPS